MWKGHLLMTCVLEMLFHTPAKEDDDYRGVSHKIVFNSDMLGPQRVYIPLLNDDCLENEELFSVTLTTEMDCVVLEDHEVTITIQDDDREQLTIC